MSGPSDADGPGNTPAPLEPLSRIEAALARLGSEHEPPVGWEARVLAATAPPRPRAAWWWFAMPGLAAAAALAFALWPTRPPSALQLAMVVEKGGTVMRMSGPDPQLGDIVHATATGGGQYRGVWVYRNEIELVARCPGTKDCSQREGAVTADVALAAIGVYQVVALSSSAPLPVPTGRFDADLAAALQANVTVSRHELTIR